MEKVNLEKAFREKKEKEKFSYKLENFLNIYIVPLALILVFFGVIILVVIPKVDDIFSKINDISSLSSEIDTKNDELANLVALDSNAGTIQADLSKVNELAPAADTEVVDFSEKIASIATNYNLASSNIRLNDSRIEDQSTIAEERLSLSAIRNEYEITGQLGNLFLFIDDISQLEDEFLVIEEMRLTLRDPINSTDFWSMTLTIVKYQFTQQDEELLSELYLRVPITATISETVQEYLDAR